MTRVEHIGPHTLYLGDVMKINTELSDFIEELEITARFAKKDGDLGLAELLSTASRTVADLAEQLKSAEQANKTMEANIMASQDPLIVAAYMRGFDWCIENGFQETCNDRSMVNKAARDYADFVMSTMPAQDASLRKALRHALNALRSHQYHNASNDLARHVADIAEQILVINDEKGSSPAWPTIEAINALNLGQKQIDEDGIMVAVSRQALDEVLVFFARTIPPVSAHAREDSNG